MGLIDIYNADTITTGASSSWTTAITSIVVAIISLVSVVVGIYLKSHIDERSRKRKLKRDGENFEAEISLLELPIKRQVVAIENYIKNLEEDGMNAITDTLSGRLDEIMKMNRADIIEYFESRKEKKPKSYVINVWGGILALSDVPITLTKIIQEAPLAINPLVVQYGDMMTELQDIWFKYKTPLTIEQYAAQPLEDFHLLSKKYFSSGNLSISKNIALIDTFHQDLRNKKFIRQEAFYITLQEYNSKAMVVLGKMKFERKKEIFSLNVLITTLKNQYKRIYGVDIDLTGVEA